MIKKYCIYRITNLINGKTYIGQHKYKNLNDNYTGSGKNLWRAYRKYGIENFKKEILVFNISKREHADLLEKTFIAAEREKVGVENCYNIADGGNGGNLGEEVNKKHKGSTPWIKGKHLSEEHRRKISEAQKGKPKSEEHRQHCKEAQLKYFETHEGTFKGKHHSEEAKRKMSEARKGKPSPCKGMPKSEEAKRKMSEAKKGKHWKLVDGKRVWY